MATRTFDSSAWDGDDKFPSLSYDAKYLFLFLILGPHSHPCGLFVVPDSLVTEHIGLSGDRLRDAWSDLEDNGLIERDGSRVWVKQMARHQVLNPSIWASTRKHLARWRCALVDRFIETYPLAAQTPREAVREVDPKPVAAPPKKAVEVDEEIVWRVKAVWESLLAQRAGFFEDVLGAESDPNPPKLDGTITREIAECLKLYDSDLLGHDQRQEWVRRSVTRAAGIGMFLDPWLTGEDPGTRGKRFLEPWRPWRAKKDGERPTQRLADLYFAARAEEGEKKASRRGRKDPDPKLDALVRPPDDELGPPPVGKLSDLLKEMKSV